MAGIDGGGRETETAGRFPAFLRCWIVIRALKELGRADAFFPSDSARVTVTSGWLLVLSVTLMLPEEATDFSVSARKSQSRKSGVRKLPCRKSPSHSDAVADVLTGPNVMMVRLRTTCPSSTDSLSWTSTTSVMTGLPEALRSARKCGMKSGRASGRGGGLLDGSEGGTEATDETEEPVDRPEATTGTSSGRPTGTCVVRNTGGGGLGGGIFLVRMFDPFAQVDTVPEMESFPEVSGKAEVVPICVGVSTAAPLTSASGGCRFP